MQLRFNVSEVLPRLSQLSSLVPAKNAIAIYSDVLFATYRKADADGVVMTITASDGDMWLYHKVEIIDGDADVRFCLNAKDVVSALKGLANQEVLLEINEEAHTVKGRYGKGTFTLPYDSAEDYPESPIQEVPSQNTVLVGAQRLFTAVAMTKYAVANDELHLVMNGVHFDFADGLMTTAASDGYKLARCRQNISFSGEEMGFTLPSKAACILSSVIEKDGGDISVSVSPQTAVFSNYSFKLVAALREGRFPDYNKVIPSDNNNVSVVSTQDFLETLNRVRSFANESSELVALEFKGGELKVTADNTDFSKKCEETLVIEHADTDITIGFKASALFQSVQRIGGEKMRISLQDMRHAAVLEPYDGTSDVEFLSILMPMIIS